MRIPFDCNQVKVTSAFGYRRLGTEMENHRGYDLVGIGSSDVVAAVGGKVAVSRIITDKSNLTWQWGNYVCIQTEDGQYHYYCHLASRAVQKGETVKAGQKIGVMGNTGYSFGAHLHFECRKQNKAFCPEEVLGIPNAVGTYENKPLTKSDYIKRIAEKANFSDPIPAIEAMEKLEHPFATDLWRKIYEATK